MIKLTEYYDIFNTEKEAKLNEGLFSNLFGDSDKRLYGTVANLCNQLYDAKIKEYDVKIEQRALMSKESYKKKSKSSDIARKEEAMNQKLAAATSMVNTIMTQINTAIGNMGGEWLDKANALISDTELRVQKDIMQKAESVLSEDDYDDFKNAYEEDIENDEEYQEALSKWKAKHKYAGTSSFDMSPITEERVKQQVNDGIRNSYVNLIENDAAREAYLIDENDVINEYYVKVKLKGFKTPSYFALLKSIAVKNKIISNK